jgi:adenylate cyclase class 2
LSIEIEAKMRLTDRAAVEARLREVGAHHQGDVVETNTFFDTREGGLKSGDQGLRIRVIRQPERDEITTITHKGPRAHGKLKSRNETEVIIQDARAGAELLGALGYLPVLSFEKRRSRWLLDGCNVELDELPYLGDYCEIEGDDDDRVLAVRDKLGLSGSPLIRASYIAMLMSYIRENHLRTRTIRFEATSA